MASDTHTPLVLRDVARTDLPTLFEQQRNPVANRMASFPARDKRAFMEHWRKILANPAVVKKAILFQNRVAGHIVCFEEAQHRLVGYWLGQDFWGKGIATEALFELLQEVAHRPLYAYVHRENVASIRVLEKCGFTLEKRGDGHDTDADEFVFVRTN